MTTMTLSAENITKLYNGKPVFHRVSFRLSHGTSCAITGRNGAGKSTLIKILCAVLAPSGGRVVLTEDDRVVEESAFPSRIGLVSPYLNMYEEFTALENLRFMKKVRGLRGSADKRIDDLLQEFGIYEHRNKEVKNYSSGMKQRLKYCAALLHEPPILVLDEPTANLDEFGIRSVRRVMDAQRRSGILLFGTNEKDDLSYADTRVDLDELKKGK